MSSKHPPANSLLDIVENAEQIGRYIAGMGEEQFMQSSLVRDAVERCLSRICEATFRLGDQAATLLPEQPVGRIRGLGNWLRHAYDEIDNEGIWRTVTDFVPTLAADARAALARLEPGREP